MAQNLLAAARGANGVNDDHRQHQEQEGDATGKEECGGLPGVGGMHRFRAIHGDDNSQIGTGNTLEAVDPLNAVERRTSHPNPIIVCLHRLEHGGVRDAGTGVDGLGTDGEPDFAVAHTNEGDDAMRADVCHVIRILSMALKAECRNDHASERAIRVMQRSRQIHMPLAPVRPQDAWADERSYRRRNSRCARARKLLVTGPQSLAPAVSGTVLVADGYALVGDGDFGANGVQHHQLVAPCQQAEVPLIHLPCAAQEAEALVHLQEVALQLVPEEQSLIGNVGSHMRCRRRSLRPRRAERAKPGERDQTEGRGDNAEQTRRLTGTYTTHWASQSGTINVRSAGVPEDASVRAA